MAISTPLGGFIPYLPGLGYGVDEILIPSDSQKIENVSQGICSGNRIYSGRTNHGMIVFKKHEERIIKKTEPLNANKKELIGKRKDTFKVAGKRSFPD